MQIFIIRLYWLIVFVGAIIFSYVCLAILAPWQLNKNSKILADNDYINVSLHKKPILLNSILTKQNSEINNFEWQRVTFTGHYILYSEVVVRLRIIKAKPAFEIITPFSIKKGAILFIDRGYIRPNSKNKVPYFISAPTGQLTVNGYIRKSEIFSSIKKAFYINKDSLQVNLIDTNKISTIAGLPISNIYIQLMNNQAGELSSLPLPSFSTGPFLSYGIQWTFFGIAIPLSFICFTFSKIKQHNYSYVVKISKSKNIIYKINLQNKIFSRYGSKYLPPLLSILVKSQKKSVLCVKDLLLEKDQELKDDICNLK